MQAFEAATADRRARPQLICPADPARAPAVPQPSTPLGVGGARARGLVRQLAAPLRLARRFALALAERRRRRRARRRLEGWMALEPRLLADIGVRQADVLGALYAGVPVPAARAEDEPSARTLLRPPAHPAPRLRLVASDDLDAAA